jgi:hypothetical protein
MVSCWSFHHDRSFLFWIESEIRRLTRQHKGRSSTEPNGKEGVGVDTYSACFFFTGDAAARAAAGRSTGADSFFTTTAAFLIVVVGGGAISSSSSSSAAALALSALSDEAWTTWVFMEG